MKLLRTLLYVLVALPLLYSCNETSPETASEAITFSRYFRMEVTRCERVANVLQVDFKLHNISGKNLPEVTIDGGTVNELCRDEFGGTYNSEVTVGEPWATRVTMAIGKGRSANVTMRVNSFEKTNMANYFSLVYRCSCPALGFAGRAEADRLKITDCRVMANGIRTNDLGIAYQVVGVSRVKTADGRNCIDLRFSMANNRSDNISHFQLDVGSVYSHFTDDSGLVYDSEISADGSNFASAVESNLGAGQKREFVIRLNNAKLNNLSIKTLTGMVYCTSKTDVFADTDIDFYDIPVE